MIGSPIRSKIQSLHQTYNDIGDQCTEVHHNLKYNIEKFHRKKEMINSFSTRKINACLEMIQREKKLTEYANSLILKQQSLKSKKNFYTKKSFSIIQVIDEEIENLVKEINAILDQLRQE